MNPIFIPITALGIYSLKKLVERANELDEMDKRPKQPPEKKIRQSTYVSDKELPTEKINLDGEEEAENEEETEGSEGESEEGDISQEMDGFEGEASSDSGFVESD